jgi:hypothetical protein
MISIYLQCFMLIPLIVLELCPGQSSKCKNKQRGIIPKLGKAELWFLCTAHLPNEIYQPTQFHVDTSCCFKVMSRTRKRTDGRTHKMILMWLFLWSFWPFLVTQGLTRAPLGGALYVRKWFFFLVKMKHL